MNKSEQINELAAALARAQGQMEGAVKASTNPFFKSRYADLAAVVNALRGPFADNGLSFVQLPVPIEGERVSIETALLHASGQWITSVVDVPVSKSDAQGYGSALTYAKRYGLQAMAGLAAEDEDDDGNAAVKAKPRPSEAEMMPTAEAPDGGIVSVDVSTGEVITAHTTRFTIAKAHYTTHGMTEAQMRESFRLVPLVDQKMGKDYAREVLKGEFGAVTRTDLTEEGAERFLIRLGEILHG